MADFIGTAGACIISEPTKRGNALPALTKTHLVSGGHVMANADLTAPVEYRPIEFFPGYRVGNDGSVWSRWGLLGGRGNRRRFLTESWKRLKGRLSDGYPRMSLIDYHGNRHDIHVHTLVLSAFVGPCPPGMQCRHLDDVRHHNHLRNLCWGTPLENAADAIANGHKPRGEKVHNAKATADLVRRIRAACAAGETLKSISSWSGISWQQVDAIKHRRVWRHVE